MFAMVGSSVFPDGRPPAWVDGVPRGHRSTEESRAHHGPRPHKPGLLSAKPRLLVKHNTEVLADSYMSLQSARLQVVTKWNYRPGLGLRALWLQSQPRTLRLYLRQMLRHRPF